MKGSRPRRIRVSRSIISSFASASRPGSYGLALIAVVGLTSLAGCSGGQGGSVGSGATTGGPAAEKTYGPIVTRAVGTAQPPVSASVGNSTVIGVAGASFDAISQVDTSPQSLADTKIAFNFVGRPDPDNNPADICVMNADGSGRKNLTNTAGTHETGPAFSPDGTKMAFTVQFITGSVIYGKVYTMNADGTGVKQLTVAGTYDDTAPAWSPDGKKIAFTSRRDGHGEIYVMNATDGSGQTRLTNSNSSSNFGVNVSPAWSPDGKKIAFSSVRDGNDEIYVMNADGTAQTRLTNNTASDWSPSWSRDGTKIAFASDRANPGKNPTDIWTMNPDGSGSKQVTFAARTNPDYPDSDLDPAWAPDGSGLAFYGWRHIEPSGPNQFAVLAGTFGLDGTIPSAKLLSYGTNSGGLSWSGYLPRTPKKLVGTGSVMASAAAGFLFSQAGATPGSTPTRSKVASIVTFDTATTNRVNARVDKFSDAGAGSVAVFTLTAGTGTLTSLRYLNSADKVTAVVGTATLPSAAGILVSFDGSDGSVATVLPYNATKAAGQPQTKPEREGDTLLFRGDFVGVWDGKGENTAPNGAHLVKIDAKTGKLIEAR